MNHNNLTCGRREFQALQQIESVVMKQRDINDGTQLIFFFAFTLGQEHMGCLIHS